VNRPNRSGARFLQELVAQALKSLERLKHASIPRARFGAHHLLYQAPNRISAINLMLLNYALSGRLAAVGSASGCAAATELKGLGNDRSTTGVGVSSGQGNFSRTIFHQSAEAADDLKSNTVRSRNRARIRDSPGPTTHEDAVVAVSINRTTGKVVDRSSCIKEDARGVALRQFLKCSEDAAQVAGLTSRQHQALLAIKEFPRRQSVTIGELAEQLQIAHE
jgi:hypothetical protein